MIIVNGYERRYYINRQLIWNRGLPLRIEKHPILKDFKKGKLVEFEFDGRKITGYDGEPIAAALKAAGVMIHRYTIKKREPRGIFCAIGRCTDCVMVVDGTPNVRTCITQLRPNMKVWTQDGIVPKMDRHE